MAYTASLCFAPAGVDACAMWRMWMPHLNVANSRYLFTEGMPDINSMSECDVIVVQRIMTEANMKFLQIARAHGLKIIFDLDDNVWSLPKYNPAAGFFSSKEAQRGLTACSEWADLITVSTTELKRVVEAQWYNLRNVQTKKKIPVVHVDNCVDFNFFSHSILPKDDSKIVIGWGGSNTHSGDVQAVWELLPSLLEDYPQVHLEFVGQQPPQQIRNNPRVLERPYCHISEFPKRFATWNWDIALAPLALNNFNYCKSGIKMMEAGAIGIPCLSTNIAPYKYFCGKSKSLRWLLCTTPYDWKRKLQKLITDRSFRKDIGQLAYVNTFVNFNVTRTAEQWNHLAQACME